ncbi:MAG: hypothetical protein EOO54_03525 [Haliea sp.]|nr:MAG: hypothetical protein EOO54_03525 [Haliea sp.]
MRAIKAARKFIAADPTKPAAKILAALVLSLANETEFKLAGLYLLEPKQFDLAIEVLNDWRLDRYYVGKAQLFDLSWRLQEMRA